MGCGVGGVRRLWKTMNRVMERFAGHRADLKGEDESKPAFHFRRGEHKVEDMGVVVLEEMGVGMTHTEWRASAGG